MDIHSIRVGMIIILYNPSINMINNIFHNAKGIEKLIIIDNSDFSNEKKIISANKFKTNYDYIPNKKNIGLAKAINIGMKILCSLGIEWCLVLDQDSKIVNDILNIYLSYIEKHKNDRIGVLGPQYEYDNRIIKKTSGKRNKRWMMLSGNMISIPAYIDVGGFNEGFFIDGLDVDFGYRLIEHGYEVVQLLGAVIHHCPGERNKIRLGNIELFYGKAEPFRYYHQARAGVYNGLCYSKIYGFYELARKLFKILFLFDHKKIYLRAFWYGVLDGVNWYLATKI